MHKKTLNIFVDGSFMNGVVGAAFVVVDNGKVIHEEKWTVEKYKEMRNVAGELSATMRAVLYAKKNNFRYVRIYHDYEGISKWTTGEWKTKNEATKLYKEWMLKQTKDIHIKFVKVTAHNGNRWNEYVDKLAKKATKKEV
ncbi:MAG: hypothetical protein DRI61_08960 [Chloroflexi bacterium]|nr:MAG: hypothetical protein DRI61_08960 [Chloroflexota bacterium]